jgi:hypothetical protein
MNNTKIKIGGWTACYAMRLNLTYQELISINLENSYYWFESEGKD